LQTSRLLEIDHSACPTVLYSIGSVSVFTVQIDDTSDETDVQSLEILKKAWQLTVIIYAIRVYDIKAINDLKFIAKALKLKILTFQ